MDDVGYCYERCKSRILRQIVDSRGTKKRNVAKIGFYKGRGGKNYAEMLYREFFVKHGSTAADKVSDEPPEEVNWPSCASAGLSLTFWSCDLASTLPCAAGLSRRGVCPRSSVCLAFSTSSTSTTGQRTSGTSTSRTTPSALSSRSLAKKVSKTAPWHSTLSPVTLDVRPWVFVLFNSKRILHVNRQVTGVRHSVVFVVHTSTIEHDYIRNPVVVPAWLSSLASQSRLPRDAPPQ